MKRSILLIIFAIFQIHCFAQHNRADSVWCDSIVKADPNYVSFRYDTLFYKNGQIKGEALILRKVLNSDYFIDIPIGRTIQFYSNGGIKEAYYFNHEGLSCNADSFFYWDGMLRKVQVYDSVNTYYSKYRYESEINEPDNYYCKKYFPNGNIRNEGCIFNSEMYLATERRGKWTFYRRNGEIRKVKFY